MRIVNRTTGEGVRVTVKVVVVVGVIEKVTVGAAVVERAIVGVAVTVEGRIAFFGVNTKN